MNRNKLLHRGPEAAWLLLAAACLVPVFYHVTAFIGFFGFDDLHYAELASRLKDGQIDWNDHFSYRWIILGMTAFFYRIMGMGDLASSLPALLITFFTLYLLFAALRKHDMIALATGLMVFIFNHWTLFYSDKIMPDVYVAFFGLAAILLYNRVSDGRQEIYLPFLFSLSLLAGFLSKETVLLLVPLLGWWLIRDLLQKKNLRFWMLASASGFLLLTGYFIILQKLTGDAASRFTAITSNSYVSFCDYQVQPAAVLLKRISYGLFQELTGQGMMAGFILTVPVFFMDTKKEEYRRLRFFASAALVLLLSSNFMTISFSAYNPMCTDPRHYLFLIPVFAIAAGLSVSHFFRSGKYWLLVLISAMVISGLLIFRGLSTFFEQLLPLGLTAAVCWWYRNRKNFIRICLFLLAVTLAIKPALFVPYAMKVNYRGQRDFVLTHIPEYAYHRLVTDEVQGRLYRYFTGFREIKPQVFTWEEARTFPDSLKGKTALLTNEYTKYLCGSQTGEMPYFAHQPGLVAKPVVVDSLLNMALFECTLWKNPQETATFGNNFEKQAAWFTPGDGAVDTSRVYEGKYSHRAGEFSSTFRIPADSLHLKQSTQILVTCSYRCLISKKTDAVTVISVDDDTGSKFWDSYPVSDQIKSIGVWNEITLYQIIPTADIPPGSRITVYLWNRSRDNIFTDDWQIIFSLLPS